MALASPKTIPAKIRHRNVIKLPEAFTMMNELDKGSMVDITFGPNFNCLIIIPTGTKVSDRNNERIKILTTDPLDSNR